MAQTCSGKETGMLSSVLYISVYCTAVGDMQEGCHRNDRIHRFCRFGTYREGDDQYHGEERTDSSSVKQ